MKYCYTMWQKDDYMSGSYFTVWGPEGESDRDCDVYEW